MRTILPVVVPLLIASALSACTSTAPRSTAALNTTPLLRVSDGDGDNAGYAYQLGREYERRGNLARAGEAYARSVVLDPDQLNARNAQAVLLAKQGELEPAAVLLRQLVAAFPAQAQPLSNLGYVYYLQKKTADAASTLRAALALAPGHAAARANLALVETGSGDGAALAGPRAPLPAPAPAPMPPASAPLSPAAAPAAAPYELIQVAPNEFRLQVPVAATAASTPTAATAMTVSAPADAATTSYNLEQLQIVNGNGAPGSAGKARDMLRQHGFATASVANQRGYRQARTVIEYVPGQQARARALRSALTGPATLNQVAALPRQLTLRLVLGQDQIGAAPLNLQARLERAAPVFNQESP